MLDKSGTYQLLYYFLIGGALFIMPAISRAQEVDTTKKELNIEQREAPQSLDTNMDREMGGGRMTEMGSYHVPEESVPYVPPFKGQEYLDMAVEAYRQQLKNDIGANWLWKFLDTISPYINNEFEFGVYQIYDQPVVDRDNPLFESYKNNDKKQ